MDSGNSTVAVTGDADPVDVITRARKTAKWARLVSMGPPPKPEEKKSEEEKPEEKKNEENKPEEKESSPECMYIPVSYQQPVVKVDEHCQSGCSVM